MIESIQKKSGFSPEQWELFEAYWEKTFENTEGDSYELDVRVHRTLLSYILKQPLSKTETDSVEKMLLVLSGSGKYLTTFSYKSFQKEKYIFFNQILYLQGMTPSEVSSINKKIYDIDFDISFLDVFVKLYSFSNMMIKQKHLYQPSGIEEAVLSDFAALPLQDFLTGPFNKLFKSMDSLWPVLNDFYKKSGKNLSDKARNFMKSRVIKQNPSSI